MVLSEPKHVGVNAVVRTVWGFIYSAFCWLLYQMLGLHTHRNMQHCGRNYSPVSM
jgi:hypothetical protein